VIEEPPSWVRLSSDVLFSSQWFELRRDEAVRPDGARGHYDHVVVPEAVTVLAVAADGRLALLRQWIYTHHERQWRLPAGRMEPSDDRPEAAARRELLEETGVSAETFLSLGTINCGDSFSNHRDHAFLATGLTYGEATPDGGESDLELSWVPARHLLELQAAGELPHAGSTYALLAAYARGLISAE
jgi:8-oxo-dGTP pyrophosphatase MutT (NUDIX family)